MYRCICIMQLFSAPFLRPSVNVLVLRPQPWCGQEGEGVADERLPYAGVEERRYE